MKFQASIFNHYVIVKFPVGCKSLCLSLSLLFYCLLLIWATRRFSHVKQNFPENLNHQGFCASVWCSFLYTYIVLKPVFVFSLIFVFILPWLFSVFLLHVSFQLLPLFRPSQITQSIYSPRATTDKITLIAGIDFEGVWQFDLNKRFVRTKQIYKGTILHACIFIYCFELSFSIVKRMY